MKLVEVFEPEDAPIPSLRKRKAAGHLVTKKKGDVKKWKQVYKDNNPRDVYIALKPIIDNNVRPLTLKDIELVREDPHALKELLQRITSERVTIRHLELEQEIITNPLIGPFYVSAYAINVIQGRWPEAEQAILSKPIAIKKDKASIVWEYAHAACHYAIEALKERWQPGEPNILNGVPKNTQSTNSISVVAYYSWMVFKGKWPDAEQRIREVATDSSVIQSYKRLISEHRRNDKPL